MSQMAKITQEEQNNVLNLQEEMATILFELGKTEADLDSVETLKKSLLNNKSNTLSTLNKLKEKENELIEAIKAKYGDVEIDLKTGEIK